jgi:hypothetical protein
MMPYDTYRFQQIARVKSPAEVRRADEQVRASGVDQGR